MNELIIIHQDAEVIVVEKPGGLLAVPGRGPEKQDCVVKRVRQLFPEIIEQPAVHRLDMDTSGLMVLARTKTAHRQLSISFAERLVGKCYIALLDGRIKKSRGVIELSFRLDPDNRPHQIHDPIKGKKGITSWHRLGFEDNRTRIEFIPLTGRTHQLRVHAAHKLGLGSPIVGDRLYGSGRWGDRLHLHASSLTFPHPATGNPVSFESSPPF